MSPGDIPSLTINSNSSITSFSFLMGVFLALIMNLKFHPQRNIESSFETQGVVMSMFVTCMLVYSITFCTPYSLEVIDDINLLAGSLASVLLTFTLFPALGRVILFIWIIHFVKLIYGAIPKLCELCQALPSLFNLRVLLGRHAHHNDERW
ncbi:hypothetical protein J1N35_036179 [Gossypium stocksii]|uniref:Uncharacterized protein n=1 Tax=Gossypium stocksii TaxID=47602 RepID=A0A9D3ZKR1_9ROSI|nr:hypothetical protein J1N35_036179 [Gossypium stocksii]